MKKFTFLCIAFFCFSFSWQMNAQFTEDFEGGVPGAFTEVQDASAIAWAACGGTLGGQICPINGTASATFFRASYTETITSLITPTMDLSAGGYRLKFNHSQLTWSGDQNLLQVDISTDGGVSWTLIEEFTASIATPTAELYLLDTYSTTANTQIRFTGKSYYGYSIVLDDVVVEPVPSCTLAVIDTNATVEVPDCGNSQFSVDVAVTSVGDGTVITDGLGGSFAVVAGTVTVGPYNDGDTVTLTVEHSDSACNFSLGDFTNTCPANQDTCATADYVTEGTYTTTINQGSGGSEMGTGGDSAFFIFTAPGDGTLYVDSCNGGADTFLNIGTGACGSLSVEDSNDDSCASGLGNNYASEVTIPVIGGTDYYIEWDDRYTSGANTFDWTITFIPPPACTPAVVDTNATGEVPDCANSQFDIVVEFDTVGDATGVSDGTNTYPIVGTTATLDGDYADGSTVSLTVVHSDSACDFPLDDITYSCPVPGDTCGNAVPLTPGTPQVGATTTGAGSFSDSNTAPEVNPCSSNYNDLEYWFEYTAGETGETLDITVSDLTNTYYGVFVLDNCPDSTPTCLASDTNGSSSADLVLTTPELTAGVTYYIVITDWIQGPTSFTINSTVNPPLTCTQAEVGTPLVVEDCANNRFFVDVPVTLVGDAGLIDDGTDTYPVIAGTVTVGPFADGETVSLLMVHSDSACNFSIGDFTNTCPPSNIDCANATPIACGQTINASSVGSTGNSEDVGCSMGDNGIWFTFTGTGGDITVETSASFDHRQAIASGSCGSLVNIVCDDGSTGTETHTFASVLNETYYVYVAYYGTFSSPTGTVDITLTCAAVPTCTEAVVASSTIVEDCDNSIFDIVVEFTSVGDATEVSDGTNTYPIVGTTATVDGDYAFGTDVTLTVVHSDNDCDFDLDSTTFDACPPDNDDIPGAIKLQNGDTMCDDPVIATNEGATDSAEGGASCGTPAGDVWFEIQIPSTGEITVETSSSGGITDTVMAIYSGDSGSLVEVACDDDGGDGLFSSITLTGYTPGDTYYVRVWEFGNDNFGTFSICAWSPSTLGVENNVFETFTYYPNPVSSVLTLKAQDNISNVTVHNMLGQEVLRTAPNTVNSELDMSGLQTGAYFVKVSIGNTTKTIRVLKN